MLVSETNSLTSVPAGKSPKPKTLHSQSEKPVLRTPPDAGQRGSVSWHTHGCTWKSFPLPFLNATEHRPILLHAHEAHFYLCANSASAYKLVQPETRAGWTVYPNLLLYSLTPCSLPFSRDITDTTHPHVRRASPNPKWPPALPHILG